MCSPSRAFWGAPRAIVGLKRGGGGWCILASAMTERVVASSHANSRLASKPSTRGGVGRRTLRALKPTCSLAWAYSSTAEYVAYSLPAWPCGEFACEVAGASTPSSRGGVAPGPGRAPYSARTRPYSVPALRRVRMRGRRSEYAEFPRGGRPRARPSAPGRPYSHTAPPGAERLLGRVRPGTRACDSCTLSFGREHDLQS